MKNDGYQVIVAGFKPRKFHTCMFDKINHVVLNYNGDIFKCTARDYSDNYKIGELTKSGVINYNSNYFKYYKKFLLDECTVCKQLPLCFGPCIQKKK